MGINEKAQHSLISRIHRVEGQLRAIERSLSSNDYEKNIAQLEAIFVATKALFRTYVEDVCNSNDINIETKLKLLNRLIVRR